MPEEGEEKSIKVKDDEDKDDDKEDFKDEKIVEQDPMLGFYE